MKIKKKLKHWDFSTIYDLFQKKKGGKFFFWTDFMVFVVKKLDHKKSKNEYLYQTLQNSQYFSQIGFRSLYLLPLLIYRHFKNLKGFYGIYYQKTGSKKSKSLSFQKCGWEVYISHRAGYTDILRFWLDFMGFF